MALDDDSRYDVGVIQMGENVFCTVWWYHYQSPVQYEISIYGSGDMYDSVQHFKHYSGFLFSWNDVWNSCSGECGAHGSSPRPPGIIYVPAGITSIAGGCFATNLNPVNNNGSLFYNNTISKIVIEGQITYIGDDAFRVYNYDEYTLIGENGAETIVNDTRDKLTEIDFMVPGYVEYVGRYAFANRTQLQIIDFGGNTPYKIEEYVFKNCYNLRTVNIGHGREISPLEYENGIRIRKGMFENCFSLTDTITIYNFTYNDFDASETLISSFKNCYSLRMINLPKSVFTNTVWYKKSIFRCDKVLYNSLLNNYRVIGDNDFELIHNLREVNFDGDYFLLFLNEMASDVTWPYCHDWHGLENRRLIEVGDGEEHRRPYIAINSYVKNNNVPVLLTIPLYPTPQSNSDKYIPINFDGRIWWLDTNRDRHSFVRDTSIYWNDYTGGSGVTSFKVCYGRLLNNVK